MGFLRRKSVAAADVENSRPRNRLSKPMTGKSPSSQRSPSGNQSPRTPSKDVSISSQINLTGVSRSVSKKEPIIQVTPQPIASETEVELRPQLPPKDVSRKTGVASLVKQFESASSTSQQSLASPAVPLKPLASLYGSKRLTGLQQQQHLQNVSSNDQLTIPRSSNSSLPSATASLEKLIDPFAIPRRRESNYRPGEATRKPSLENKENQSPIGNERPQPDTDKPLPKIQFETPDKTVSHEEWNTPAGASLGRAVTPANLEHRSLGGLRLGSLHIVNGRSSPVLSELSRHLISRQLRDVSSEYADSVYSKDLGSEAWEDEHVIEDTDDNVALIEEPVTPTRVISETEAHQAETQKILPKTPQRLTSLQLDTSTQWSSDLCESPDRTSMMAQFYMSELQNSPFSVGTVSPESTTSIIHYQKEAQSPFIAGDVSPVSTDSLVHRQMEHQNPSLTGDVSPVSASSLVHHQPEERSSFLPTEASPASIGSIRHRQNQSRDYEIEEDYAGRAMDHARNRLSLESAQPSVKSEQLSTHSKPSVTDTVSTRNQVFSSALEYHAPTFRPPPSPERGVSPESHPGSMDRPYAKTDSGYDSGDSVISLEVDKTTVSNSRIPLTIQTAPKSAFDEAISISASPKTEQSPRKLGRFFPGRPSVNKAVVTEPLVPTLKTLRYESSAPAAAPIPITNTEESPTKMAKAKEEVAAKPAKKLHKSRPLSRVRQSNEIVVQRLASCGSTTDIPAIPAATKANLQLRSQQVPELERTFKSQHHVKNQTSNSSLAIPTTDIRFPSPMPSLNEDDQSSRSGRKDHGRSKSRHRSKSRRRSFLDMFRSDKDSERQDMKSAKDEKQVSIADFGDVFTSLGANPYDAAQSRPRNLDHPPRDNERPRTNPHNISTNTHRKRLSMNDEEASEFARRRSHSFGRDERGERRPFVDSHGMLPIRLMRSSLVEEDVPPIPPMPDKEELKRISQRYSLQFSQPHGLHSPHLSTPSEGRQYWDESPSSDRHPDTSFAPLPPAHSPRPSFVQHFSDTKHPIEQELELAPPPPSHSPAPMDISGSQPPSHSRIPRNSENGRQSGSPWDAQAKMWRERRNSAGEMLYHHRESLEMGSRNHQYRDDAVIEDDDGPIYPVIPSRPSGRTNLLHQQSGPWVSNQTYDDDDYEPEPYPQRSHTWDNGTHDPYRFDHERQYHSQSSYQARQQRHHTWDEGQSYGLNEDHSQFSGQDRHRNRRPMHRSHVSTDSQRSFYSHHNRPIDRPFDEPTGMYDGSDDEYTYQAQYYTPQASPVRGRGRNPQQHDYSQPNGYERQYHQQSYNQYQPHTYQVEHHYEDHHPQPVSKPSKLMSHQEQQYHSQQFYSSNSPRHYRNHQAPPSPEISRPSSRHSQRSFRSNGSVVSLAEELHPDIQHRPSAAPDYGRYSGGMNFGYEGRDRGFGGSAGTRSVSGRADAMFKGTELRGSHGVDLGDVPVIGIVKKVQPSTRSEHSSVSARTAPSTTYLPAPVSGQTSSSSSSSC